MFDLNGYKSRVDFEFEKTAEEVEKQFEQDTNELMSQLLELRDIATENLDKNKLSPKEKRIIDSTIKSIQKSESKFTQMASVLDMKVSKLATKFSAVQTLKPDTKVFEGLVGYSIPYCDVFMKRPRMHALGRQMFGSVSQIMRDPAERTDPLGASLGMLVQAIVDGGFVYKGAGDINTYVLHINLFTMSDRGTPQTGKTMKELGYTPGKVMEIANAFTTNKKYGFFRMWWTAFKSEFYTYRFLWDLIVGRSEDEINRFDGIAIRRYRLSIIKSISLHQLWLQGSRDISICERLLGYVQRAAGMSGYEALDLTSIRASEILTDSSILNNKAFKIPTYQGVNNSYIQDLKELEFGAESLRKKYIEKESYSYSNEEFKKTALKTTRLAQITNSRQTAQVVVDMFRGQVEYNTKLLGVFENLHIALERLKRKIVPPVSKSILSGIEVDDVVSYYELNPRIVTYSELKHDISLSISDIFAPVTDEKSLGKGIESYIEKCRLGTFEIGNINGLQSCVPEPMFKIEHDTKRKINFVEAGYNLNDLFRFTTVFESVYKTLTHPTSVLNGKNHITDHQVIDALSQPHIEDKVDPGTAAKIRRIRYGVLNNIRSEIFLNAIIEDCLMTIKLYQAVGKACGIQM